MSILTTTHYDPLLSQKLGLGTRSDDGPLLNSCFGDWTYRLNEVLASKDYGLDRNYRKSPDREIFAVCRKHAAKYANPKPGKDAVLLTHPFYLSLAHMNRIHTPEAERDLDAYESALMRLLEVKRASDSFELVFLETAHHYAGATSLLLEQGTVDDVIFTRCDSGQLMDSKDLRRFEGVNVYFGGGYNNRCLTSSLDDFVSENGMGRLWLLRELLLNSPLDCLHELRPGIVHLNSRRFPKNRMMGLDEALGALASGDCLLPAGCVRILLSIKGLR
ncbi:hypothetical protein JW826_02700 [Candidatus Woesearchaeota archaeon]|nr:hypothetical protein [Candidatus Woesearchaeota archaeon]